VPAKANAATEPNAYALFTSLARFLASNESTNASFAATGLKRSLAFLRLPEPTRLVLLNGIYLNIILG
jgi:hypothetical protein